LSLDKPVPVRVGPCPSLMQVGEGMSRERRFLKKAGAVLIRNTS
jgi:hypothetical protein